MKTEFLFIGPGLLRTVVVLVVLYYGGKFLFKWWLRMKVARAIKQREATISEAEASNKRHQEKGSVHIKSKPSEKSYNSSGGDYVDYEEVD